MPGPVTGREDDSCLGHWTGVPRAGAPYEAGAFKAWESVVLFSSLSADRITLLATAL